ncbi:MAG TPA: hypothetical protein DCQ31_15455 [Bacteroidales bacterium]|nr:hypothetical protein [Bacteroidales bacterium]
MFQGIDIDLNVDTSKYTAGKDRYMEFKPKRVFNSSAEYGYRSGDASVRFVTQYMNMLLKNYTNPTPTLYAYDTDFKTSRYTNSLTFQNKLNDRLAFELVGAYTYYGRQTDNVLSDLAALEHTLTGNTLTVFHNGMSRGSLIYEKPGSKLSGRIGYDINYDYGTGDKLAKNAQMGDFAGFVSTQYDPLKWLSIQPGLRFIYNTVYGAPIIPSVNVQWTIFTGTSLRASYAKGFRAPGLKELYIDFKDSNHNIEGNKNLKAEKSDSYNLSISSTFGKSKHLFKIEPSFYLNNGTDAITMIVTDTEANAATNVNLGGRRTLGTDVKFTYMHTSGLTVGLGYSKTGETYDYLGNDNYIPIVYYDNYLINFKYNLRKFKTVFNANFKYYGITPAIAMNENTSEYYQVYTEAYTDVEATVTKLFWKDKISVVIGGKNLMNNYSRRTYGYIDSADDRLSPLNFGRTFFVKLNFSIL